MSKLSKQERETKINHAKKLYVKGFDVTTIAEMLDINKRTVANWANIYDFDQAKKVTNISISEVRNEILNTYETMKKGETPTMSPDQISKLVSGLDKLTVSQKSITWIIEAYELLTDSFLADIQNTKSEKQKEKKYETLKTVRQECDKVITKLQKEML